MKHLAKRVLGMGLALTCALTLALGAKATNAYADDVYDYEITAAAPNGVATTFTLTSDSDEYNLKISGLNTVGTKFVLLINGVERFCNYLSMEAYDSKTYNITGPELTLLHTTGLDYDITARVEVSEINVSSNASSAPVGPYTYTRCVTIKIADANYTYPPEAADTEDPVEFENWLDEEKYATAEAIVADVEYTVLCNDVDTLDREFVELLRHSTKTSLELNFTYEGVAHQVVIPAGQAPTEDLDYYGPLWLIKKYGDKLATPKYESYVIQKGDSLGKLAKKWGTTVDALMALNPQIKDNHWIYVGDTLVH